MRYRLEIDALNALVEAQQRTNELLLQLIHAKPEKPVLRSVEVVNGDTVTPTRKAATQKRTYKRRAKG